MPTNSFIEMNRKPFLHGYVQVYTGDGKGKTTAALGLALRCAGAGYRVFIAQFIKCGEYSEQRSLRALSNIACCQYGRGYWLQGKPSAEDIQMAQSGLREVREIIRAGNYKLVILDEACIAAWFKLLTTVDLLELIDKKPEGVELVFTGRKAPQELLDRADLVTEMREIKHYYSCGVLAREGIES